VREGLQTVDALTFEELNDISKASEILNPVDLQVLGFSLDWHHSYFYESKYRCLVFRDKADSIVGYGYIRPTEGVGPVAVTSAEFMAPALATALKISSGQDVTEIGYYTPGSNVAAVDLALRLRMKFEPFVFMSTRPFGRWENYIFHSAALM
jgi:hypothetical protein